MARRQYARMLFPILMVVLFAYVFGSAIKLPGNADYREFLMPGIYMQVTAMSATVAAGQAAEDKLKGMIDRFKSLPIARSSVLVGRSLADLTLRLFGLAVMVLCGVVLAGWRVHHGVLPAAEAFGLLALFGNPTASAGPVAWPLRHPIGVSVGWSLLILAVFIPLAVRRYHAASSG